jgi:CspA family cold shock protein
MGAGDGMRVSMMAVGRVVKFDEMRGFGFIAPIGSREDVFLHVNDLLIPESLVRPGAMLKFDIDEGERGLKASNISLHEDDAGPQSPGHIASAVPATNGLRAVPVASVLQAADIAGGPDTAVAAASPNTADGDSEEFCDLLTAGELSSQVTDLLLTVVPPLAGDQILNIRSRLADFAKDLGWLAS